MAASLLTTNAKLSKAPNGSLFLVAGLAMAPHNIGGTNVCQASTAGCRSACNLWFAGRTVMPVVRAAMESRKRLFVSNPQKFYDQLHDDIDRHARRAAKLNLEALVRPNVASDIDWAHVIKAHPTVKFYDYTKVLPRAENNQLPNYQLTYSHNERSDEKRERALLSRGLNIAIVFDVDYQPQQKRFGALPATWYGAPVVDGDLHDFRLREVDGNGVVVGLRLKGGIKARENARRSGFAINPSMN